MRIPLLACALLATTALLTSGCLHSGAGARTSWFRPGSVDDFGDEELLSENADLHEEEKDEWGFVGKEGRQGMETEKDPDPPWLRNFLMSDKARAIERNLGFE